ncbi:HAMP domain-containing histidine kinase [Actinotalea sp. M2MS4P-6]|uniref:sensor histidine kinase n=1 Tax=Actinotalea sp. M2MS4P-6 TaxID=2983762 RepID=UPI0021E51031|nr:HAMP domain-containing sensor histidine kinase [Actinotalea sp. M2MS4P-6]MCV2393717.1 HAMP domain-containing histidine kinase [Actinotalea sp. M2MS4P-6]
MTSLRTRTALLVGVTVLLGLLVAGVTGVLTLRSYLFQRTDDQLVAARDTVTAALERREQDTVREQLLRDLLSSGVRNGEVHLLEDDRVVASLAADGSALTPPDAAQIAALGAGPGPLDHDTRAIRVDTPGLSITLDDGTSRPVDAVLLARDISDDRLTIRRTALATLLIGTAVAAVSLLAVWWAVGRGLRPLRLMAERADQVAAGDHTVRLAPLGTQTETAGLAKAVDGALDARATAEQRVRDFVADAAHELRTPLTSVHGWADLYLQGGLDADGVDHAMERIEAESTRMRHLVDQMSLLARLDADLPLDLAPLDLRTVVDDVIADLDVLAPDRPVTWGRPEAPVTVSGDRARLHQVVTNLVGNVLRHTPDDAALEVVLNAEDGEAVLVVHDDGPGVPADLALRVFERFVRQTSAPGGETGAAGDPRTGSGLGLAIVAGLVEAHGGRVGLESVPGEGTTVRVTLPLA